MPKKRLVSKEVIANTIVDIFKKGGGRGQVTDYLKTINQEKSLNYHIYLANKIISEQAMLERASLINTHIKRYEKLYEENINKTDASFKHLPANIRRYMLIDSYAIALDALVAKEKVLGLHTRNFRVQLNNFFKKKTIAEYNFSQLQFNELLRLKQLLEKMKSNEVPVQTYFDDLEEETKGGRDIVDIDYVEVNDKAADKIKETIDISRQEQVEPVVMVNTIKEKIIKEDIKRHDLKRKGLLDKLKKL